MKSSQDKHVISPVLISALLAVLLVLTGSLYAAARYYRQSTRPGIVSPSASVAPSDTPSPVAALIKIPELGIELAPSPDISDAYYSMDTAVQPNYAEFSTRSLVAAGGSSCEAGATGGTSNPIGSVTVSAISPSQRQGASGSGLSQATFIKQIGSEYVYFIAPQSVCSKSPNSGANALETQQVKSLQSALQTAELIK